MSPDFPSKYRFQNQHWNVSFCCSYRVRRRCYSLTRVSNDTLPCDLLLVIRLFLFHAYLIYMQIYGDIAFRLMCKDLGHGENRSARVSTKHVVVTTHTEFKEFIKCAGQSYSTAFFNRSFIVLVSLPDKNNLI